MSMFNDIDWTKNGKSLDRISNSREVRDCAKRFQRHWSFSSLGNEEKWYGTYSHEPEGKWDNEAAQMIAHLKQSGHPVFRGTSALNRGGGENDEEIRLTSQRNQQTLHFYFAQFTRQMSSVSTEQYRVGVLVWLKR